MQTTFEEKRKKLLCMLQMLALKHNRDYYISLIPFVESATLDQEELINMYHLALEEDVFHLSHSRQALVTVQKINSIV
ncbi:hypothetical protein H6768_00255 [Candidatus Peribacteria bacterium]|nr:hypothetical protein [Candidatus Peribacteria bacterium]